MTHSRTSRRVALLATGALVGAAFTVTPVVAQGDPNVCDGVIDGAPLTLDMTMHTCLLYTSDAADDLVSV